MENKIWVPLKYKGNKFGEQFSISGDGYIRNNITKSILKGFWEHRKYYNILTYEGKNYRVCVGLAQVESNIPRSVMDRPAKVKGRPRGSQDKPKYIMTEEQQEDLTKYIDMRIKLYLENHKTE